MKRTKNMIYSPSAESRELFLYTTNTYAIYSSIQNTIESLKKKYKKGIYDREKAIDSWYYVATFASDRYNVDFGYKFTVTERFTAAVVLESYFKEDVEEEDD